MIYFPYTYIYHITEIKWRHDRRCGTDYLLPDGTPAQCNPADQAGPCCSEHGYCGGSHSHCECAYCIDYRFIGKTFQNIICVRKSFKKYTVFP